MKDQPQPSPALRKALGWGRGRTGRKGFGRAGAPSTKKKRRPPASPAYQHPAPTSRPRPSTAVLGASY